MQNLLLFFSESMTKTRSSLLENELIFPLLGASGHNLFVKFIFLCFFVKICEDVKNLDVNILQPNIL